MRSDAEPAVRPGGAGRARARRRLGRDRLDADRGLAGGALTAGSAAGPGLQVQPPPYPLLADV